MPFCRRVATTETMPLYMSSGRIEYLGRLRGLWKVDCEGYISALAHNLKKAVRRLGDFTGPPLPDSAPEPVVTLSG